MSTYSVDFAFVEYNNLVGYLVRRLFRVFGEGIEIKALRKETEYLKRGVLGKK